MSLLASEFTHLILLVCLDLQLNIDYSLLKAFGFLFISEYAGLVLLSPTVMSLRCGSTFLLQYMRFVRWLLKRKIKGVVGTNLKFYALLSLYVF